VFAGFQKLANQKKAFEKARSVGSPIKNKVKYERVHPMKKKGRKTPNIAEFNYI